MSQSKFYWKQLEVGPMENFVYLIGDLGSRECYIVDPAWDVDYCIRIAEKDGLKVRGGLMTHTHFDHANGVEPLVAKTGGKIHVHKNESRHLKIPAANLVAVDDGYRLTLETVRIEFIHTPGHTPGGQCFLAEGHLFSGDTLFVNACGRCDLEGSDPRAMYRSLRRLADLPEETVVLPGHHYGSVPVSTIGREKTRNPYLQCRGEEDFLAFRC